MGHLNIFNTEQPRHSPIEMSDINKINTFADNGKFDSWEF